MHVYIILSIGRANVFVTPYFYNEKIAILLPSYYLPTNNSLALTYVLTI